LSIGLITNFLSLKEIFLMSLHGNPIFGVSLEGTMSKVKKKASMGKHVSNYMYDIC
jgi:hypothetical protein